MSAELSFIGLTLIGDRVYRNSDLRCTFTSVALTYTGESLMVAITVFFVTFVSLYASIY